MTHNGLPEKICVCGGGSLGIVCASVFLAQGISVSLLTGHPGSWHKDISVSDPDGKIYAGRLSCISSDPEVALSGAEMVLLCLPGYLIEDTLRSIKPWLAADTLVGAIVSSTGFFFAAHRTLDPGTPLFGFQRVPYIARYDKYGATGRLLGYKPLLKVAVENADRESVRLMLQRLFSTPVELLNNFYEASLTNSNPLLHTSRLYSMWGTYDGEIYPRQTLFYAEWTDDASELLTAMDSEFMALTADLGISREAIPSILEYYGQPDAHALTLKIRSIPAFATILSPMKSCGDGWVPDFGSRYFTEDFPFGLRLIADLARSRSLPTPVIDRVLAWGLTRPNDC